MSLSLSKEAAVPQTISRTWAHPNPAGLSRKDRATGTYAAFVPDELGTGLPAVGKDASAAAEGALTALARLDERIGETADRYLNHLLIRSESISSSWIEGNRLSPKKLAIAELLEQGDRIALDVIGNVRATEDAISELSDPNRPITTTDIEALQHTIEPQLPRGLRTEQNWVGGPGNSPLRAQFVPPPETEVHRLIDDLATFLTSTDGNPVVRAAIAHAQFETIHPFTDGNGRTGRALIHTVLRRGDAVRNVLVPISTVFANDTDAYIDGLTTFRSGPEALDGWIISFAESLERAAAISIALARDIDVLDRSVLDELVDYRRNLGKTPAQPRAGAVVLSVLDDLSRVPVQTIASVVETHHVSPAAAHRALTELVDAGILRRTKNHKGKIVCFTADRHLAALE